MSKIPTAEEFSEKFEFIEKDGCTNYYEIQQFAIEFAKLHVAAALQAAKCFTVDGCGCGEANIIEEYINECYLLENIK